jgi:hypothetical protein
LKVAGVVTVRPEDPANVLAFESRLELLGIEEFVFEIGGWRAQLVALIPVASTA